MWGAPARAGLAAKLSILTLRVIQVLTWHLATSKQSGLQQVGIHFKQRKGNQTPDPAGYSVMRGSASRRDPLQAWRQCACQLQGKRLCAICVIHEHIRDREPLLSHITYECGLAFIKIAAAALNFPGPLEWGTHAIWRGREDLRCGPVAPQPCFNSEVGALWPEWHMPLPRREG